YNRSKIMGDELVSEFARRTGLPTTIVRPGTIFGPRSKDWVVELCRQIKLRRALTIDGGCVPAGLVYVDDVIDGMIRLAGNPSTVGRAFNIVDPDIFSWREYFCVIADAIGEDGPTLNLGSRTAAAIATANEFLWRALGRRERPLLTRHLVFLLSR